MTSISVAMATYNGERYLPEQLDSLLNQTCPISELVVSDDTSIDSTIDIIAAFAKTAPFPVRIEKNTARLGFRRNFMKAADLCTSDLIAFCDQDDIWHPNKLEAVQSAFLDGDTLLVHHNANVFLSEAAGTISALHPQGFFPGVTFPLDTDPWVVSHGFTQVFRRSLNNFIDLWPHSIDAHSVGHCMAHDQWYIFLASVLGQVNYISSPLADYRQHQNNTFGWRERPTFATRVALWFEDRSNAYDRCRLAAERRKLILQDIASRTDGAARERAVAGAERYQLLAHLYELRTKVYVQPSARGRLQSFSRLRANNAYNRRGFYTFSKKGMFKDLALGAFLGPAIALYGPKRYAGDATCRAVKRRTCNSRSVTTP